MDVKVNTDAKKAPDTPISPEKTLADTDRLLEQYADDYRRMAE